MQNPQDQIGLFDSLNTFSNKILAVLFYAAIPDDKVTSSCFASILNSKDTENDPTFKAAVSAFADFAGSDKIEPETKKNILKMFSEVISRVDDPDKTCVDMMRNLGIIGKTINQDFSSKLGRMYQWWLPKCKDIGELERAVSPDRQFIASLAEMQTAAGESGVASFLKELRSPDASYRRPAIPLQPIDISNSEVLGWVRNAIPGWVKTHDANGLLEKAMYVAGSVLDDSLFGRDLVSIQEVADNLPELKGISDRAEEGENEQLYLWAQLAGLLMIDTATTTRNSPFFKDMLNGIAKFQGEQSRLPATACLYMGMRNPGTANKLESFSAQFKPKHSKIFVPSLFALTDNGRLAHQLNVLLKTVQNHRFRDTKKAIPLLTFISEMALVKSLSSDEKCRIVRLLTEEAVDTKNGVTPQMTYIMGLAKIGDAGTVDSAKAVAGLKGINNIEDALATGKLLFKILFSVPKEEIDVFSESYDGYLERSRNPTALLSFAILIYMGIKETKEREDITSEISLLAKGLIADDDGKILYGIRYSIENNEHNAFLHKNAPLAWEQWKEDTIWTDRITYTEEDLTNNVDTFGYLKDRIVTDRHVDPGTFPLLELSFTGDISTDDAIAKLDDNQDSQYKDIEKQLLLATTPGVSKQEATAAIEQLPIALPFLQLSRDIKDLKKKLTAPPLSLEKCKGLRAEISSRPEDLLLIGTEVIGSCQSIHGRPELNKALPGYVLDGKYLSAQVTNEHGFLMSRRMLRLLWSEEYNKPVIYVEREYSNPGVPRKIQDACLQLIHQKAEKMNALVATDDEELVDKKGREIGPLQAYKTPRP